MSLIQKAFSDIITFSRSSNATRIGPTGRVEYAPHNLLLQSQTFDNASWTKSSVTATANSAAAPDGTVTSELIAANADTGTHRLFQNAGTTTNSQTATFSLYVKYVNHVWIYLRATVQSGSDAHTWFNIQTGTKGDQDAGITNALITSVGNGWYRVSITFVGRTSGDQLPVIGLASSNGNTSWTATGTESVSIWGAQLSVGPYPLDYTPTTSAAVYGPRFDYDPVTLAARGLLIEEQRTNLLTYSEQFDNAAWTKSQASITANAIVAPDGTTTADKLVENATTNSHIAFQSFTGSAVAYTLSVFAKAGERSFLAIRLDDASVLSTSYFDLSNGTVSASGTGATCSIQALSNGWYRCSVTRTLTVATYYAVFGPATSSGNISYAGDGTSGIYIWGAQLEAGSFATSYIPTVAASVTRSADVASVNTLSPWFNATEGTLFAEAVGLQGQYPHLASPETDASNLMAAYAQEASSTTRTGNFDVVNGGAVQAGIVTTQASSAMVRLATAYKLNDFAVCLNGGTVATDTSGTVPASNKIQIGSRLASNYWANGCIRRIAYYPRRLTNAELVALSA